MHSCRRAWTSRTSSTDVQPCSVHTDISTDSQSLLMTLWIVGDDIFTILIFICWESESKSCTMFPFSRLTSPALFVKHSTENEVWVCELCKLLELFPYCSKIETLQKLLSHMSGPLSPGVWAAASPHQLYSHIIAMSHNGTSFNKEPAAYTPFNVWSDCVGLSHTHTHIVWVTSKEFMAAVRVWAV